MMNLKAFSFNFLSNLDAPPAKTQKVLFGFKE
jgi:hypothetical protein